MKARLHHNWQCDAELVDIFTPGVVPNGFKIDTYLGSKAGKSFREGKFKETQLIFKAGEEYVVIPDTSGNKWLWSFV